MRRPLVLGVLSGLSAIWCPTIVPAAEIAVGVAAVDITPPRGYRMAGYFNERANTGTKDPLMAKAIVLRQGDRQVALVFCDLVGVPNEVSSRARALAMKKTGIPATQIAVCATHSHTGPLYHGVLRRLFHDRAIENEGLDRPERVDYPALLADRVAGAIASAQANLAPARLSTGFARQEELSFNRRFHMKDGSVVFNPGVRNPNALEPAGPIDPDVGLLAVRGPDGGAPRAALTVFALHLDTVGGTEYSADYPHHLQVALGEKFGKDFLSLFGAGTCGDINHINTKAAKRLNTEMIGNTLARTILARLDTLAPIDSPSLAFARTIVEVPLQQYDEDEVTRAREKVALIDGPKTPPFLDLVKAVKIVDLAQNYPQDSIGLEIQAFRLSDSVALVTLPGEVFVELGLAIKRESPFVTTIVIELANDSAAYIPTRKAFAEGSYEVVNSRVAPGGGEELVAAAIRILKDLAR